MYIYRIVLNASPTKHLGQRHARPHGHANRAGAPWCPTHRPSHNGAEKCAVIARAFDDGEDRTMRHGVQILIGQHQRTRRSVASDFQAVRRRIQVQTDIVITYKELLDRGKKSPHILQPCLKIPGAVRNKWRGVLEKGRRLWLPIGSIHDVASGQHGACAACR